MIDFKNIKVSVVVPVKNRENTIARAINSIITQCGNFSLEIIIVDDASIDNTIKEIIPFIENSSDIFLLKNEKSLGGAVCRNLGAKKASGDFIAFLDSDDEWKENHLNEKLNLLKQCDAKGCCGSFNIVKGQRIQPIILPEYSNSNVIDYIFIKGGDMRTSTFIFEKDALLDILFDDKLDKHQDWDLMFRFADKYKLVLDTNITVNIYVDISNRMSNSNNYAASDYFLNKHIASFSKQSLFNFKLRLCVNTLKFEGLSQNYKNKIKELSFLYDKGTISPSYKYFLLKNKVISRLLSFLIIVKKNRSNQNS
jgi:glycosyltransferase involved in cell wall biosynthesis